MWQQGGVITALITPFRANLKDNDLNPPVNSAEFQEQIERQVAAGVSGIVPVGTTGESPTLTGEEHDKVIRAAVRHAKGQVSVIAGAGSNCTHEAIALTRAAEEAGADAILQVAPYYNKPTQEGLFQHFSAVARTTTLPMMLYNVPSRCGVEISIETIVRLIKKCPNIIALKEAGWGSANRGRLPELRQRLGPKFLIFSGNDDQVTDFICRKDVGGIGVVSVISNLVPKLMRRFVELACASKDGCSSGEALDLRILLDSVTPLLFKDGNPAGIKQAMRLAGLDSGLLRLPLVSPSEWVYRTLQSMLCALVKAEASLK